MQCKVLQKVRRYGPLPPGGTEVQERRRKCQVRKTVNTDTMCTRNPGVCLPSSGWSYIQSKSFSPISRCLAHWDRDASACMVLYRQRSGLHSKDPPVWQCAHICYAGLYSVRSKGKPHIYMYICVFICICTIYVVWIHEYCTKTWLNGPPLYIWQNLLTIMMTLRVQLHGGITLNGFWTKSMTGIWW